MTVPQLSVIVPAFGRERETARAVASALSQDVDLEIIVVDDGSPEPVSLPFDDARVRIARLDRNGGAAHARNVGVANSRAGWIAFLDSDDVWLPRTLRPRLDVALVYGREDRTIWSAGFVDVWAHGRGRTRIPRASNRPTDFASGCWCCPGSTALFSRSAWQRLGPQDVTLRRLEDFDWLFRWAMIGGSLEVHPITAAEIYRGRHAQPDIVSAAVGTLLRKYAHSPPTLLRRMESYLNLEIGAALLRSDQSARGMLALARSLGLRPRLRLALEDFWLFPTAPQRDRSTAANAGSPSACQGDNGLGKASEP